jgi:DNA polymerase-3 subunit delta'
MQSLEVLTQSIKDRKLGHAILLESSDSVSLSASAESLAGQMLNTDSLHTHPDFFTLRPSGRSRFIRIGLKDERTRGSWPENTMRRLIEDLQKTSNQGGHKVAIVYEAERMNKEAANAFLKTLEEPPPDTVLFLLTSRPYDLIDTIKSRCLSYKIPSTATLPSIEPWEAWKMTYWNWMGSLVEGWKREKLGGAFFGFYGMILKLQNVIGLYRDKIWDEEKEKLRRELSEDEKTALEIGIERTVREKLFSEIAEISTRFMKETAKSNDSNYLIYPLSDIIKSLEKSLALLQLNFNAPAALELFFLKSIRIWASASKNHN